MLESKGPDWVQVTIGGSVSLHVSVPSSTVDALGQVGDEVHLHTRLYIRDDEVALYGFSTAEALRLFQTLNGVSGIGPRTSLALLSRLGPQGVASAVATGDLGALSGVPGVGRKTAGRLVLELKGKFEVLDAAQVAVPGARDEADVVSALMALGYTATEARRVLASIEGLGGLTLEEKVRRALQELAAG